jgi:hypothetical protein
MSNTARNVAIGENLYVPLTKEVVVTKTGTRPSMKELTKERDVSTAGGESTVEKYTVMEPSQEEYTYEEKTTVPDLSPLTDVDIFTFAYGELAKKLKVIFPGAKIVDC